MRREVGEQGLHVPCQTSRPITTTLRRADKIHMTLGLERVGAKTVTSFGFSKCLGAVGVFGHGVLLLG